MRTETTISADGVVACRDVVPAGEVVTEIDAVHALNKLTCEVPEDLARFRRTWRGSTR